MNKTRIRILLLLIVIMCAGLVTGSVAYWRLNSNSINILQMGKLDGELVDDNKEVNGVYPGDTVDRVVQVKNVGELDFIVRMKVIKEWEKNDDKKLDTEKIQISYNTTNWLDGKDGYYYYKGIVESGKTTEPLFTEFSLDPDTDNIYMKQKANINVQMECLQSTANAISTWDKTYTDLGIKAPETPSGSTSTIALTKEKKLEVGTGGEHVLFPNFVEMTPGEVRAQTVNLENKWTETVEFFLHAESVVQAGSSNPEDAKYINDMLLKYTTLVVSDKDGKKIYEGPASGNYDKSVTGADSLKEDVSLGKVETGKDTQLTVELKLDPEMDNEFQELAGKVKWVITVQGEDAAADGTDTTKPPIASEKLPYTGGNGGFEIDDVLMPWALCGSVAMLLAIFLVLFIPAKKRNSQSEQPAM